MTPTARENWVHVLWEPKAGHWSVQREGNPKPVSTHATQEEAEKAGTALAKQGKGEILVHGKDGAIQRRNSYGGDSFPPKG